MNVISLVARQPVTVAVPLFLLRPQKSITEVEILISIGMEKSVTTRAQVPMQNIYLNSFGPWSGIYSVERHRETRSQTQKELRVNQELLNVTGMSREQQDWNRECNHDQYAVKTVVVGTSLAREFSWLPKITFVIRDTGNQDNFWKDFHCSSKPSIWDWTELKISFIAQCDLHETSCESEHLQRKSTVMSSEPNHQLKLWRI